jgi:hypothetical protein
MRRCLWRRLTGGSQVTSSLEWLTIRTHPLHIFELKGIGKPFARSARPDLLVVGAGCFAAAKRFMPAIHAQLHLLLFDGHASASCIE